MLVRISAAAALLAASFATAADAQGLVPGDASMLPASVAPAPESAEPREKFWFDNGFAKLHEQIGSIMGTPVEAEHPGDDDDVVQRTTTGLAVWKDGEKLPTFTDGWRKWAIESPAEQRAASVSAAPVVVSGVWAALAQCESGNNPRTNTGNGYYGMFQEDKTFWANYGNPAYARPDLAPVHEQLAAAQRGLAKQGRGAWPTCGPRVGLR